jgi:hypothetical protein
VVVGAVVEVVVAAEVGVAAVEVAAVEEVAVVAVAVVQAVVVALQKSTADQDPSHQRQVCRPNLKTHPSSMALCPIHREAQYGPDLCRQSSSLQH